MRARLVFCRDHIPMKTFAWPLAFGALACTATIVLNAQRGGGPPRPSATAGEKFVVIGCITREPAPAGAARGRGQAAPRFTLVDARGETPARYELQGDAEQLDLHTGHTMEVKGPLSTSTARGTARGAAPTLVMKVETMTWLASSCAKKS
jgi:hypothetical protein